MKSRKDTSAGKCTHISPSGKKCKRGADGKCWQHQKMDDVILYDEDSPKGFKYSSNESLSSGKSSRSTSGEYNKIFNKSPSPKYYSGSEESMGDFIVSDDEDFGRKIAKEALGITDTAKPLYDALTKLYKGKWKQFINSPIMIQWFAPTRTVIEGSGTKYAPENIKALWYADWAGNLQIKYLKRAVKGHKCILCSLSRNLTVSYYVTDSKGREEVFYAGPDCDAKFERVRYPIGVCKRAATLLGSKKIKPGDPKFKKIIAKIEKDILYAIGEGQTAAFEMSEKYI